MLRALVGRLAVLVILAAASPNAGAAFTCEVYDGENCIRWLEGQATVKSFLGNPGQVLINGTITWDQNTFLAAGDWNTISGGLRYNVTTEGELRDPCTTPGPCPGTGAAGENPVIFRSSVCGGGSFGPDVIAQTVSCFRRDNGAIVNAPVFFNQNVGWNAYDGNLISGATDIRRVLLHELGHVAGLGHPDDAGQNMLAIMNRRISSLDRPQQDDIDGMRSIYTGGQPPPPVTTSGGGGCNVAPAQSSGALGLALLALPLALLGGRRWLLGDRCLRSGRPGWVPLRGRDCR